MKIEDNSYRMGKQLGESVDYLVENRMASMGIAISMVMLYHLFCVDKSIMFWRVFYPGFMGVDIFLFLSSYGLCFSLNRNTTKDFYKRRFIRILPVYFLLAIIITYITALCGEKITAVDFIYNITSLSYWGVKYGQFIDWYLSTLIWLYLLFPFIYKVLSRLSNNMVALAVNCTLLAVMTISTFFDFDWKYECSYLRLPIFLSGIAYYKNKQVFNKLISPFYLICFIVTLPLLVLGKIHTYMTVYMLAPVFLYLCPILIQQIKRFKNSGIKILNILGKYSLEIYAANVVTMSIISISDLPMKSLFYFLVQIVTTLVFVYYNKIVTKNFEK